MVEIRMASTTECDRVLWGLFLLEVDQTGTKSDYPPLNSRATYSVISAANDMADIRGACSTMPAFVIVLFPHLRLCVVVEVRRT
jgi:hypothetical protein